MRIYKPITLDLEILKLIINYIRFLLCLTVSYNKTILVWNSSYECVHTLLDYDLIQSLDNLKYDFSHDKPKVWLVSFQLRLKRHLSDQSRAMNHCRLVEGSLPPTTCLLYLSSAHHSVKQLFFFPYIVFEI